MRDKLQRNKKNKKNGYFLIEVIIAITLLITGFLGMLTLLSNSIALNRVVNDNFTANYLAMEGIEIVKNLIDGNIIQEKPWNDNIGNGEFELDYASSKLETNQSRYILFDLIDGKYGYQTGNPTAFKRTIYVDFISADQARFNSIVKWKGRGGGNFEINLESYFFNWK